MLSQQQIQSLYAGGAGESAYEATDRLAMLRKALRAQYLQGRVNRREEINDDETASLTERSVGGMGTGALGTMQAPRSAYMDGRQYAEGLREAGEYASLNSELAGRGKARRGGGGYPAQGGGGARNSPALDQLREVAFQERTTPAALARNEEDAVTGYSGLGNEVQEVQREALEHTKQAGRIAAMRADPTYQRSSKMYDEPYFERAAAGRQLEYAENALPLALREASGRAGIAVGADLRRAREMPEAAAIGAFAPNAWRLDEIRRAQDMEKATALGRLRYSDPVILKGENDRMIAEIRERGRVQAAIEAAAGRTGAAGIHELGGLAKTDRELDPNADVSRFRGQAEGMLPPTPPYQTNDAAAAAGELFRRFPGYSPEQIMQEVDRISETPLTSNERLMLQMALRSLELSQRR